MSRLERFFVLYALAYMVVYVPVFVGLISYVDPDRFFTLVLPFHFLGMLQNLVAILLTIRDLYLRPFPTANQKVTWALLIVTTGGIGWLVYVFKYALKPRVPAPEA